MAIMNPLKPRMGKRATLCIAVSIWVSESFDKSITYGQLHHVYGAHKFVIFADFTE
jgi:hypothetical protein